MKVKGRQNENIWRVEELQPEKQKWTKTEGVTRSMVDE